MLICADLGNTITTLGILAGASVNAFWPIVTRERTRDEYGMIISSLMDRNGVDAASIEIGGVCSVVPSETDEISEGISSTLGVKVQKVDGNSDCGIQILTDNPAEVGGDRIANATGAFYGYGGPAIIVDLGTATTFDFVSERGEYMGGIIAPGVVAGARDLWQRARMLPAVEIKKPLKLIGTTTVECMQAGIFYGSVGQVEGIVSRMWHEIGTKCKVIVTGGQADLIWEDLSFPLKYDPHLTLKGIAYAVDSSLRRQDKSH